MTLTKYTTQEQIEAMRQEILNEKQKVENGAAPKRLFGVLQPHSKKIYKILSGSVFLTLTVFLMWSILSIQMTKSRGGIPNVFGFQLFEIQSGSMEPTLKIGSVIVSRIPKDPQKLQVNDIVTFRTLSNAVVTHRIVEVMKEDTSSAYRTKGDNPKNTVDRELLTPNRVIGVFVAKIPLT